jgi:PAB-dependent poly(A)-specific ribonuclease subunit 3
VDLVRNDSSSHFVPPSTELRQILQEKSETIRGVAPFGITGLPEELQGYHTLVPLEPTGAGLARRKLGNWHSTVYRAIKGSDGTPHALRRVESQSPFCGISDKWLICYQQDFRLMHQAAFGPIEAWSKIQHPNIVPVREAFTTKSFNDNCE